MKTLYLIDPYAKEPSLDGINILLDLCHQENVPCKIIFPFLSDFSWEKEHFENALGVISLGSYYHVESDISCVRSFLENMKTILEKNNLPFFGICFSHQALASMYGGKVGYILETNYEKGFLEPRKIDIQNIWIKYLFYLGSLDNEEYSKNILKYKEISLSYPKSDLLDFLEDENMSFYSAVAHYQEVKNISSVLKKGAISSCCEVEALVHSFYPFFSVQSHPEREVEKGTGVFILRGFIRFVSLLR